MRRLLGRDGVNPKGTRQALGREDPPNHTSGSARTRPQTWPPLARWGMVLSEKPDKLEKEPRVSALEAARVGAGLLLSSLLTRNSA